MTIRIENYELLQCHPYCLAVPEMEQEEYEELREDISGSGQLEPIVIFGGQILDGRHRFRACLDLGIEPWFVEYDHPDSPMDYVISINLRRRHWDKEKKAMVYAKLCNFERGSNQYEKKVINGEKVDVQNYTSTKPTICREEAAKLAGVSARTISSAKEIAQKGTPELVEAVEKGKVSINRASQLVNEVPDKAEQREIVEAAKTTASKTEAKKVIDQKVTEMKSVDDGAILVADWVDQPLMVETGKTLNKQNSDSIGWAAYSWNPVTGCTQGCEYCYARDIANRFNKRVGFDVAVYPERMGAPYNVKNPSPNNRVFVCSMADLFGNDVPYQWIDQVLHVCRENTHLTFILLTKNPKRLKGFTFPDNCWVGTTVDTQRRMDVAERVMPGVDARVKWVSIEPMLEQIIPADPSVFDWYVIGGASKTTKQAGFIPNWEWVFDLALAAKAVGSKVWIKDNFWSKGRPMEVCLEATKNDS